MITYQFYRLMQPEFHIYIDALIPFFFSLENLYQNFPPNPPVVGVCKKIKTRVLPIFFLPSRVHQPVDFPAWCEVRVEPVTCKALLVQAADPRLPCSQGNDIMDPSHGSLKLQHQLEG